MLLLAPAVRPAVVASDIQTKESFRQSVPLIAVPILGECGWDMTRPAPQIQAPSQASPFPAANPAIPAPMAEYAVWMAHHEAVIILRAERDFALIPLVAPQPTALP